MHLQLSLQNYRFAAGLAAGFGFYLLCAATALVTGLFTPWGSACTFGLPVGVLLLGMGVGIFWTLTLVGCVILERAGRFSYGCLMAHGLVLIGAGLMLKFL